MTNKSNFPDALQAEAILHALHAAWTERNIDRMLNYYCSDVTYTCNLGPGGEPAKIIGRDKMREFLSPILEVAECMSVVKAFSFDGTGARATVASFVRHKATGMELNGRYRQVVRYRGSQVAQLDEFHDAAKLEAFWRLVAENETQLAKSAVDPI